MNKINGFYQEFANSWKKGWPDYFYRPEVDNKDLYEIAQACAIVAKVDLDVEEGFTRILRALELIAKHCRSSDTWKKKNMFTIKQCLTTIVHELKAAQEEQRKAATEGNEYTRLYQIHKQQLTENERIKEEQRRESEKWYRENWTDEQEREYQAYMKSLEGGKVIPLELAKLKSVNKAM